MFRQGRAVMTSIKFRAVGDMMFGDSHVRIGSGVRDICRRGGYNFPLAKVKDWFLEEHSLLFGNLECPMTSQRGAFGACPYIGDIEPLNALSECGFNVLSLANNHIFEYGLDPARETAERLKGLGIKPVGLSVIGIAEEVINYQGHSVVFLAFSAVRTPRCDLFEHDTDQIRRLVELNSQRYDVVVVSLHWGAEFVNIPARGQMRFAHSLVDAGARVVLGHHPHVVQPVEYYKTGLIAYSLGNFVFDMPWLPLSQISMILTFYVPLNREGRISATVMPVRINERFQPVLQGTDELLVEDYNRTIAPAWNPLGEAQILDEEYAIISWQRRLAASREMRTYLRHRLRRTTIATFWYLIVARIRRMLRKTKISREQIEAAWRLL